MAHIKWDSAALQAAAGTAKKLGSDAGGCASAVKQARGALDWQVGSSAGIDQKLQQLTRRLNAAQSDMAAIARAAGSAASLSQSLDSGTKREIGQITFSAPGAQLLPAAGGAYDGQTVSASAVAAASLAPGLSELLSGIPKNDNKLDVLLADWKFLDKLSGIKKDPLLDGVGYVKDGVGIVQALIDQDGKALAKYAEKYGKKGAKLLAKTVDGMKSGTATLYFELGKNFAENLMDLDAYSKDGATLAGFAGYAVHVTGGTLLETAGNVAFDHVNKAFTTVGLDYKKWSGYSQFTDIYEDWKYIGGVIAEQAPKALKNTVQQVGNAVNGTVSAVGGFFSKLFK